MRRLVVGHGDGAGHAAGLRHGGFKYFGDRGHAGVVAKSEPDHQSAHFTTLHCTTGIAARQPVRPPIGRGALHREPQQRAAVPRLPCDQFGFGFQRHRVDHQPSARRQRLPDRIEHAVAAGAAADEHHVRRRQILQRLGRAPQSQIEMRHAERARIGAGVGEAILARLDADRAIGGMRQQPFDPDRARAGADVPQQFAAARRQRRQRHRADLALGQLAVMGEQLVGQAGDAGQDDRAGFCVGLDRDRDRRLNIVEREGRRGGVRERARAARRALPAP